jgi:hypothetical protein
LFRGEGPVPFDICCAGAQTKNNIKEQIARNKAKRLEEEALKQQAKAGATGLSVSKPVIAASAAAATSIIPFVPMITPTMISAYEVRAC